MRYCVCQLKNMSKLKIGQLFNDWINWSNKAFAEATPESSLIKLEEEIAEIRQDLSESKINAEEYADAIMCLLDSAGRLGISGDDIVSAFRLKFEINKRRTWIKQSDNTYKKI